MIDPHEENFEFLFAFSAVYAWLLASANQTEIGDRYALYDHLENLPFELELNEDDFHIAFTDLLYSFQKDFVDGTKRAIARIEPIRFNRNASIILAKFANDALDEDEYLVEADEEIFWEVMDILELGEEDLF